MVVNIFLHLQQTQQLKEATSHIIKEKLNTLYHSYIKERTYDLSENISLKLEGVINELNILRGIAQQHIDEEQLHSLGDLLKNNSYIKNSFEYNRTLQSSNSLKSDIDIGVGVWSYLHKDNGEIKEKTQELLLSTLPLKNILSGIKKHGLNKGWIYHLGPKETPVMTIAPWINLPVSMEQNYLDSTKSNFWDFFFPNMVEGWERWLDSPTFNGKKQITFTPIYEDAGGTGEMFSIFAPLWDKNRTRNHGAVALDYNIDNLLEMIETAKIGENGFSFLLQRDGNILGINPQHEEILGLTKEEKVKGVRKTVLNIFKSKITNFQDLSLKMGDREYILEKFQDKQGKNYLLAVKKILEYNLWTGEGIDLKKSSYHLAMVIEESEILDVSQNINEEVNSISQNTNQIFFVVTFLIGLLGIFLAAFFAMKETKQVDVIQDGIKAVNDGNYQTTIEILSDNELGEVAKTFNIMTQEVYHAGLKLENHALELEEKVANKTKDLNKQLTLIRLAEKKQTQLLTKLKTTTKELANAKQEVEEIHKHTQDSIEYASLIQRTLIPEESVFNNYFCDHFAIWQPKDIVGGDIYFFEELREEDECLLMVIDCTGHGVPGAFVTMMVKAIEEQIVAKIDRDNSIDVSPAWILSYFNKSMKKLLQQESLDSISNVGFDGAIIYYNKKEKLVKFAGAHTPVFIMEKDEVRTIKGDRYSVGYKKCKMDYEYSEHTIEVRDGMSLYLTTDGYLDQCGGNKGFSFGKRRFKEMLEVNYQEEMENQKEIFLSTMKEYQGERDTNDDIAFIGITI